MKSHEIDAIWFMEIFGCIYFLYDQKEHDSHKKSFRKQKYKEQSEPKKNNIKKAYSFFKYCQVFLKNSDHLDYIRYYDRYSHSAYYVLEKYHYPELCPLLILFLLTFKHTL